MTRSSAAREFGVQSYCFRAFKDNRVVASKVRGIGLDKMLKRCVEAMRKVTT